MKHYRTLLISAFLLISSAVLAAPTTPLMSTMTLLSNASGGTAQWDCIGLSGKNFRVSNTVTMGHIPTTIAMTKDGQFAYVLNAFLGIGTTGTVSVIDNGTQQVVKTIPVGYDPTAIALTKDGQFAYVANDNSKTVSIIDINKRIVVNTISMKGHPQAIAMTKDGQFAYVANASDDDDNGAVSIIDIAKPQALPKIIPVGQNPVAITMTEDGQFAYVVNSSLDSDRGTVSVIDTNPKSKNYNTVIKTIPVGQNPVAIAMTEDGQFAYVVNSSLDSDRGTVTVIDINSTTKHYNPLIKTILVGEAPTAIAMTKDGQFAYVVNKLSNNVSVIDIKKQQALPKPIPVGGQPLVITMSKDGKSAYVVNYHSNTVSIINTKTQTVANTISVGQNPAAIAITNNGVFMYVANDSYNDKIGSVSIVTLAANFTWRAHGVPLPGSWFYSLGGCNSSTYEYGWTRPVYKMKHQFTFLGTTNEYLYREKKLASCTIDSSKHYKWLIDASDFFGSTKCGPSTGVRYKSNIPSIVTLDTAPIPTK